VSDYQPSRADVLNAADDKSNVLYVYVISAVAAVGGLLFGFDTAIIAGAIEFVKLQFHLNPHQEGFAVSSLLIGCIVGAGVAGITSDRYGRKKVLIATSAFYVLSAVLAALPHSLSQLAGARFLGGLAVGVSSMVAPLYIAEISPARIRGRLVTLNQMAIVTGILLADVVSWLLEGIGDANWRWMFASAAFPAIVLLIGLLFVPESPRWLAKAGQHGQALAILTTIGGRRHAESEMAEIESVLAEETGSLWELFGRRFRLALVIGIVLAVLGQITGINTIIYYAPKIFLTAGFEKASAAMWASVLVGITNFTSTIVALCLIDKVGRKPLLLFGPAGMGAALALAGIFLTSEHVPAAAKVAIILAYIVSFAIGVGGTVWVVISEIFPTKIRGRAVSLAVVSVWTACFAVAQTFPYLIETFGQRSFWIYAVMCAVMFLFVLFVLPETKGESLEQIERMWKRRTTLRA
jgi:SP family arabinose:H+ symporter-like MFS transporter